MVKGNVKTELSVNPDFALMKMFKLLSGELISTETANVKNGNNSYGKPFSDDEKRNNAPQVVTCNDYQREVAISQIRPDRQTLYWSAARPKDVKSLARQFLRNPYKVITGSPILKANQSLNQVIEAVKDAEKYTRLIRLLKE
ncbi:uvrABC system, subunit B [Artemisia annua]|uniref:UvrABC system, subunit B n=1 Tax=Artemisia annua TaxID=35608 RepID=A0A2U1L1S2_ARTAN|nr:uvrABC system, subunit B [Artemisia annua]